MKCIACWRGKGGGRIEAVDLWAMVRETVGGIEAGKVGMDVVAAAAGAGARPAAAPPPVMVALVHGPDPGPFEGGIILVVAPGLMGGGLPPRTAGAQTGVHPLEGAHQGGAHRGTPPPGRGRGPSPDEAREEMDQEGGAEKIHLTEMTDINILVNGIQQDCTLVPNCQ
mmetsp:Transcript_15325/g.20220  ORF Transcript_15325/g.20220 Transcript_15325/m.20220 type:complete len:168 (+) Transcript_15325:278-781(+)